MTSAAAPSPLGLIAGNGRFPFLVADAARRSGRRVVAVAIKEEASPDLASAVDAIHWVGLGQTVIVKDRAAVALEAMEGTDEAIRRAGRIAGPGCTVVKLGKPKQDMRFDVPVAGPGTLEVMREAGARVLAVEALRTLFIDKAAFLAQADEAGIAVIGLDRPRG